MKKPKPNPDEVDIFGLDNFLVPKKSLTPDELELLRSASFDNMEKATNLLNRNISVNIQDNKGNSPLINAISHYGSIKMIKLLINYGANINIKNNDEDTPLICTVRSDLCFKIKKEIIEELLSNGANINTQNNNGNTALYSAAFMNNKEILELLLANKADINIKNKIGQTALIKSVINRNKEMVSLLFEQDNINIHIKDKTKHKAYQYCQKRNINEIADIFHIKIKEWKKLLYKSIYEKDMPNFKKYLLKLGSIYIIDHEGNTLLHHAIRANNIELFLLLINICQNQKCLNLLNKKNKYQKSILHYAVFYGRIDFIKVILKINPQTIDEKISKNKTLFDIALSKGLDGFKTIKALIEIAYN